MVDGYIDLFDAPFETPFILTQDTYDGNIYFALNANDVDGEPDYVTTIFSSISLREYTEGLYNTPVTALDITGKNLYDGGFGGTVYATEENGVLTLTKTKAGNEYTNVWSPPRSIAECTICINILANIGFEPLKLEIQYADSVLTRTIASSGAVGQRIAYCPKRDTLINRIRLYSPDAEKIGATIKINDIMIIPTASITDTTYSPCHKTTLPIPAKVQALDGYGWGIPNDEDIGLIGAANGIEWDENGKPSYVKRVERVAFDGTEAWEIKEEYTTHGPVGCFVFTVEAGEMPLPTISSAVRSGFGGELESMLALLTESTENSICLYPIYGGGDEEEILDLWKEILTYLYESGNPLTVYYKLAEPIVTDISAHFTEDNLIAVEGGGTITAVNEHNQAAPSTIVYQKRGV